MPDLEALPTELTGNRAVLKQIMDNLLTSIHAKKIQLDRLRPISTDTLKHLQKYYAVELLY